jgi:hypothetical protein
MSIPERKPERKNQPPLPTPEVFPESEQSASIKLGGPLAPEFVQMPKGAPVMQVENGKIQLDEAAYTTQIQKTKDWVREAVLTGDEHVLGILLRNIDEMEESAELRSLYEQAFAQKDPKKLQLDAVHVNLPIEGIAERSLIRDGLRSQLARQPFTFHDRNGVALDQHDDLDIVFARKEDDETKFKLIIGSKKGIIQIGFQDEKDLPADKFRPDLMNIDKDSVKDVITIPLKSAKDGEQPYAACIEIRQGALDLPTKIANEEKVQERARKKKEREDTAATAYTSSQRSRWASSS